MWNIVFVGDEQAPQVTWRSDPYTVVKSTPVIREKPYLTFENGNYAVQVPTLKSNVAGTSWSRSDSLDSVNAIPISDFYIAKAGKDNADSLNTALGQRKHLILTPGIYHLDRSLDVAHTGTVILGLGMATLIPDNGTSAITIADVDGVSVTGLIFDAGPHQDFPLLVVGPTGSNTTDHCNNPTALFDLCCRVGGATVGSTQTCFVVNSSDVIMDNVWIWRADHGRPGTVEWDVNPAETGLVVNGNNVIAYGLFVEHFQGFQTIWNGDGGQVYFYQSELPYDPPYQGSWQQGQGPGETPVNGFASYKVADTVNTHTAQGLGVYCNFTKAKVWCDNAIEAPTKDGVKLSHMVTVWLDGKEKEKDASGINHVFNRLGDKVTGPVTLKATL